MQPEVCAAIYKDEVKNDVAWLLSMANQKALHELDAKLCDIEKAQRIYALRTPDVQKTTGDHNKRPALSNLEG